MPDWSKIEQKISSSVNRAFRIINQARIAGGDTNQAYQIKGLFDDESQPVQFFIKFNQQNRLDMFEAEADGLKEIEKSQTIRVPHVIASGIDGNQSYLILENLSLTAAGNASVKQLGEQLAKMHQTVFSQSLSPLSIISQSITSQSITSQSTTARSTTPRFGWWRDNTIGSSQQPNTQTDHWVDFWREQRLGFQLDMAKQNGVGPSLINKGEALLNNLDSFFIDYEVQASLLHGDLWSGNYGYINKGEPVIFDPAVYYGDREADMAMTELFGGFPAEFYSAYNETWPLNKGYQQRKTLYNLYHILNHANLFGGGYVMQAENMIDQLNRYT